MRKKSAMTNFDTCIYDFPTPCTVILDCATDLFQNESQLDNI